MTMNEYLAAKRAAELGEPSLQSDFGQDDGFVVIPKEGKPEVVEPMENEFVAEQDDDGFMVIPNPGVKQNKINVGLLLQNEQKQDLTDRMNLLLRSHLRFSRGRSRRILHLR